MTRAEAHVWIATYSAVMAKDGFPFTIQEAVARADYAVAKLQACQEKMSELDEALRQEDDFA